jgi:hypothetical protein
LDREARAIARSGLPSVQTNAIRSLDTEARAITRFGLPSVQRNAIRSLDTEARQTARDSARISNPTLSRFTASGARAMPDDFPTQVFLDNFERNPVSAQSLFWARSGNYLFASWRDYDFSTSSSRESDHGASDAGTTTACESDIRHGTVTSDAGTTTTTIRSRTFAELRDAIQDEADVTDTDMEKCVLDYTARMDPTQPLQSCACCGTTGVSIAVEHQYESPQLWFEQSNIPTKTYHFTT